MTDVRWQARVNMSAANRGFRGKCAVLKVAGSPLAPLQGKAHWGEDLKRRQIIEQKRYLLATR